MSGYRKLRNLQSTRPLSRFLFGDEISKSVKDITRANKIMAKVMPKKRKTSSDDRQNKRPFLRDRLTASRRGHYNTASTIESSPEGSRVTTRRTWRTKRKCKLRRLFI